jgi:hypothetical protein
MKCLSSPVPAATVSWWRYYRLRKELADRAPQVPVQRLEWVGPALQFLHTEENLTFTSARSANSFLAI